MTRTTKDAKADAPATGLISRIKGALSKKAESPKPTVTTPSPTQTTPSAAAKKAAAPKSAAPKTAAKSAAKPVAKPPVAKPPKAGAPLTAENIVLMSEDDYMNEAQLQFFRERLLQMREEVVQRELDVKERLHDREVFADPADRASAEEEHWLDLRLRERESLLIRKVDEALRRIDAREYGYCEKTGDPIGIPRLLARPTATTCIDVKSQDERIEAQYRDR
ncbi:RNA polymerase-binding protein DksA [Sinimarinibacterium sp. NLF-5-8]|nr:RNA polymerase-binding protein DksA [Sinimarinibacterium sp. NLF-5-8]